MAVVRECLAAVGRLLDSGVDGVEAALPLVGLCYCAPTSHCCVLCLQRNVPNVASGHCSVCMCVGGGGVEERGGLCRVGCRVLGTIYIPHVRCGALMLICVAPC